MDHDPLLYVTQLRDLLRHVGWKKCNFVGLSLVRLTIIFDLDSYNDTGTELSIVSSSLTDALLCRAAASWHPILISFLTLSSRLHLSHQADSCWYVDYRAIHSFSNIVI